MSSGGDAAVLRRVLLGVTLFTVGATLAELGLERHWDGLPQRIPWAVAAIVGAAALALALRPGRATIVAARLVAAIAISGAALGVYKHIEENHAAGALDYRYAATWDSLSSASQWWKAATKAVGPAPVLAPGILAQSALLLLAATVRHPAASRGHPG
jgi:hypothetical protein